MHTAFICASIAITLHKIANNGKRTGSIAGIWDILEEFHRQKGRNTTFTDEISNIKSAMLEPAARPRIGSGTVGTAAGATTKKGADNDIRTFFFTPL